MEPRIVIRDAAKVVGLAVRTSNRQEASLTTGKIPGLWNEFFASRIAERIPNRKSPQTILGVYTDYESGVNGEYSLIVGVEVDGLDEVPPRMRGVAIPAGSYLAFPVQGPMPKAVIETWEFIWKYFTKPSAHQRVYTTDFELYERNTETQQSEVGIYVAVK